MEEYHTNPNPCISLETKKSIKPPNTKEQLDCPRCKSNNTKFCYYNNYSPTQPRYFCKSCRRYWTQGGSLRNVPIGGGSRKNISKSTTMATTTTTTISLDSSSSSSSSLLKLPNYPPSQFSTQNQVGLLRDNKYLNLAFPKVENVNNNYNNCGIGFRGLSPFIPNLMPNSNNNNNKNDNLGIIINSNSSENYEYPSGFSLGDNNNNNVDELKPSLGVEGFGDGRNLVSFQELNQQSAATNKQEDDHQIGRQLGYWSGMLGGGSL